MDEGYCFNGESGDYEPHRWTFHGDVICCSRCLCFGSEIDPIIATAIRNYVAESVKAALAEPRQEGS